MYNDSVKFYTAISYVGNALKQLNIPFTVNPCYEGFQLRFPWCDGDIVCHKGSYGHSAGHVESYRFPWDDDDVTEMTPKDAATRITGYYLEEIVFHTLDTLAE